MVVGQYYNPLELFTGCFIPNTLLRYTELSPTDKLVWARLSQYTGYDGLCYPSQETIAYEIGVTKRTVIKSIQHLEELKFIKVERTFNKSLMKRNNNVYSFLWHKALTPINKVSEDSSLSEGEEIALEDNNLLKEKRNIKEKRKPTEIPFLYCFPRQYAEHPIFPKVWDSFVSDRKERKIPITERATKLIVNKIRRDCRQDITKAVQGIQQAIERGYRGVFFDNLPSSGAGTRTTPTTKKPYVGPRVGCDPHER